MPIIIAVKVPHGRLKLTLPASVGDVVSSDDLVFTQLFEFVVAYAQHVPVNELIV